MNIVIELDKSHIRSDLCTCALASRQVSVPVFSLLNHGA